jgi:hypothetical protein
MAVRPDAARFDAVRDLYVAHRSRFVPRAAKPRAASKAKPRATTLSFTLPRDGISTLDMYRELREDEGFEEDYGDIAAVLDAIQGNKLVIPDDYAALAQLVSGLGALSNTEDAAAEQGSQGPEERTHARKAVKALDRLTTKAIEAAREMEVNSDQWPLVPENKRLSTDPDSLRYVRYLATHQTLWPDQIREVELGPTNLYTSVHDPRPTASHWRLWLLRRPTDGREMVLATRNGYTTDLRRTRTLAGTPRDEAVRDAFADWRRPTAVDRVMTLIGGMS